MAGVYFYGFPADTPHEEAIASAMASLREDDQDAVTAGPTVIPAPGPDEENPEPRLQVRVVTGVPDPRPAAEAVAAERDAVAAEAEQARLRLASLTPEHLSVLDQLVKAMRDTSPGGP